MSNTSEELFENDDLLSILNADTSSKSNLETAISNSEDEEQEKKLEEIKALSTQLENDARVENAGSGNISDDLSNWFDGVDSLPSTPLNQYVSNAALKMDYGLTRHTLNNFSVMGKLENFLDSTFPLLFDESVVFSLTPAELEDRVKIAFSMYKEYYNMSGKTTLSLKDARAKGNEVDEVDQLRMLLSSISSDKLSAVLSELSRK